MKMKEKAIELHKKSYPCSTAVLSAFSEVLGVDEKEVFSVSKPMAGGKMGKCGAVLAAEYVISKYFPENVAKEKIEEFEKDFKDMNGSLMCNELRGIGTGKVLRSCRGCVSDSAELLENLIVNNA